MPHRWGIGVVWAEEEVAALFDPMQLGDLLAELLLQFVGILRFNFLFDQRRAELIEKRAQLCFRQYPIELKNQLPVTERLYGWDGLNVKILSDALTLIDIHLGHEVNAEVKVWVVPSVVEEGAPEPTSGS